MCWLPVVGPSTIALVRHIAHVTADGGEAHVPLSDLGRQLGLGPVEVPSRNNRLIRTLTRAEQFGLAFSSIDVPGESMTLGINSEIALVPSRMLERLPDAARQYHAVAVEAVNEALTSSGLPTLQRHAVRRDVALAGPVSPGGVHRPPVTSRTAVTTGSHLHRPGGLRHVVIRWDQLRRPHVARRTTMRPSRPPSERDRRLGACCHSGRCPGSVRLGAGDRGMGRNDVGPTPGRRPGGRMRHRSAGIAVWGLATSGCPQARCRARRAR